MKNIAFVGVADIMNRLLREAEAHRALHGGAYATAQRRVSNICEGGAKCTRTATVIGDAKVARTAMPSRGAVLYATALVFAFAAGRGTPARAQDLNCVCVDGVLYCDDAPSYQSAPDYNTPAQEAQTYQSYEYAPDYSYAPQEVQSYEPTYTTHTTYSAATARPAIPPQVVLLGFIAFVVALVAAAFSSTSETGVDKDIAETQALTEKLEDDAREADARIAAYLNKIADEDGGGDG